MPATPKYKIYNPAGKYVIACRYAEDAALCCGFYGPGTRIKVDGRIVWREGDEEFLAEAEADRASTVIHAREADYRVMRLVRRYAS